MLKEALLLGIGLSAALAFLVALWQENWRILRVCKPVPLGCLMLWLWPPDSLYTWLILLGLGLSALGDSLLEGAGPRWFLFGLGSFLAAHLVYLSAFLTVNPQGLWLWAIPFLLYGVIMLRALWAGLGPLKIPVLIYLLLICAMWWRSAGGVLGGPAPERGGLALIGASLFVASDTLLAFERFGQSRPWFRYAIMLLYWAGQAGLAGSALIN